MARDFIRRGRCQVTICSGHQCLSLGAAGPRWKLLQSGEEAATVGQKEQKPQDRVQEATEKQFLVRERTSGFTGICEDGIISYLMVSCQNCRLDFG